MPQDEPKFTCAVCQFVFSSDDIWIAEMKIAICIGCWERNVPENRLPFPKGLRRDLTAVLNGLQGYDAFFKEAA